MLILIVASGPDKGRIYELTDGEAVVAGREGDRIQLNDTKASRRHAQLWCEGGTWYIRDCGSRHGTYRNQKAVEGKTQLKDGDRLQIGHTVFVLARMPAEQAERAALLGIAPNRSEAEASLPKSMRPTRPGRRYLTGAAAAIAVLAIIGANLVLFQKAQQLQQDIRDTRTASRESNDTILAAMRDIDAPGQAPASPDTEALKSALAKVHEQQDAARQQLADIRAALASKPRDSRPLLDAILAQAEAQRRQAKLLAGLRETIQQQQAQTTPTLQRLANAAEAAQANRQSLAQLRQQIQAQTQAQQALARSAQAQQAQPAQPAEPVVPEAMREAMDSILAELKARPSAAQLVEPLRQAITTSDDATRQKLETVLARLDAQDQLQRSVAQLRETLTAQSGQTETALAELRTAIEERDTAQVEKLREQLAAQQQALALSSREVQREVAGLRDEVSAQPEALAARLDPVLGALAERDAQRQAVLDSIAQLKRSLPTDVTPLVKRVLENQDGAPQPAPSAEQIAEAVAAATAPNAALRDQLARLEAQLKASTQQTAGLPEAAQQLAARQEHTSAQLDAVLQAVQREDALEALSAQVQQLAAAQTDQAQRDEQVASLAQSAQATQRKLDALFETVNRVRSEQRSVAQSSAQARAEQLARIERMVSALPGEQRAQLSESMTLLGQAMRDQSQQTGRALAQLQDAVRQRPTDQQLAAQLDAMQQADAQRSAALGEQLAAQFQRQPAVGEKLAHLGRLIEQQPEQTRQQIETALSKLDLPDTSGGADQRQVLEAIAELKQAMPRNLTPLVEQVLAAVRSQPRGAGDADGAGVSRSQAEALAQALHQLRGTIGRDLQALRRSVAQQGRDDSRMAARQSDDAGESDEDGVRGERLTKTEMAYKLAYQTGEPVTIGAGVFNPATGEVSEGRTLDPDSAKAAGIDNWRAWYRLDSAAERMRLQRQAREYAEQSQDATSVIDLPDPAAPNPGDGTAYASPSDDATRAQPRE